MCDFIIYIDFLLIPNIVFIIFELNLLKNILRLDIIIFFYYFIIMNGVINFITEWYLFI